MFAGEREAPDRKAGDDRKPSEKETAPAQTPPHKFDDWASI